jgi:hypothetical protein
MASYLTESKSESPNMLQDLILQLVWWHTPIISALGRLKQEDCEFEGSLGYMAKPCLNTY